MFRVRQITDPLIPLFDKLVADELLPANIELLLRCGKTVKHPPFVYTLLKKHKWAFSHFGIFMEHLIREMLAGNNWKKIAYKLYIDIAKEFTNADITKVVPEKTFYTLMGRFTNISKYITTDFSERQAIYDYEYKYNIITGHPDIVFDQHNAIYDVKTVTKFDTLTTKKQAILQLTAYIALAREAGHNPEYIGVILPYQQQTLVYDLSYAAYDHKPFMQYLIKQARPRICTMQQQLEYLQFAPVIGNHTTKVKGKIYDSLVNYYSYFNGQKPPCQLFLRGNQGAQKVKITEQDIIQTLSLVVNNNIKFFVHASYSINLCHPYGIKTKGDDVPWATNILREDLQYTASAGGRGVVVHTGKGMHLDQASAYAEMKKSVLSVIDAATEQCPLLIETPCDKGTELCGTPESLAKFYNSFTIAQQKKIKICIDTCHVFAAGYLPYDYLITFSKLAGESTIALIHLNDAQWAKGSGHDGHEQPGRGCIGMTEMLKAISWCHERNIPMVRE